MKLIIILIVGLFIHFTAHSQIITTFAGNGTKGTSGNNIPATSAQFSRPTSVCADHAGNIYVSDHDAHIVKKIDPSGIITTFAGTGTEGYSGDGGLAILAELKLPYGLCIDNDDNLYIVDHGASVVRKVDQSGIITTIAGTGVWGFSGDGGPAINAQFHAPTDICRDNSGNFYVSDFGSSTIRKINSAGTISTYAGRSYSTGNFGDGGPAASAELSSPGGICIDNVGNLYICDIGNNVVRKVDNAGIISTVIGSGALGYAGDGGPADQASLSYPYSVCLDNNGNIYIGDVQNWVVRKINTAGIISTIAGNGTYGYSGDENLATLAKISTADDVFVDNAGNIYIADGSNYVVRRIEVCPLIEVNRQPISQQICNNKGNVDFIVKSSNAKSYQWQVNKGSGWSDLTDNSIYNGSETDSIYLTGVDVTMDNYLFRCKMSNGCSEIFSLEVSLIVRAKVTPSITISTGTDTICSNSKVTFYAAVSNGGGKPNYLWMKNGILVGDGADIYTDSVFIAGDIITCSLVSNEPCRILDTAKSNSISMVIVPSLQPEIVIAASDSNICKGKEVIFTAIINDGGVDPYFRWLINGKEFEVEADRIKSSNFFNGDMVSCEMILKESNHCIIKNIARSNIIQMGVFDNPTVSLDKSNGICKGSCRQLDAGNFESYSWSDGSSQRTLTVDTVGKFYVTVTNENGCIGSDTTVIDTIYPLPEKFLPENDSVCKTYGSITIGATKTYRSYLWNDNTSNASIKIQNPGIYWLEVVDDNFCKGRDYITVYARECMEGFYVPNAFTPNGDGKNDLFKPQIFGDIDQYYFVIYNRFGQIVFLSSDIKKGWDGIYKGKQQDVNNFAWKCSFKIKGRNIENRQGTVLLIK